MAAIRAVKESFRDPRLQMAAPLAVFIGIEQAFMYAGFSKVSCFANEIKTIKICSFLVICRLHIRNSQTEFSIFGYGCSTINSCLYTKYVS